LAETRRAVENQLHVPIHNLGPAGDYVVHAKPSGTIR
jgi:hypothetical protein